MGEGSIKLKHLHKPPTLQLFVSFNLENRD